MGPNAILTLDEITQNIELKKGMRVLDLGCGTGLTLVFLAKEYGVQAFAVDLWISATDNYKRFLQMGVDDLVIPIHADATVELPFADEYFNALISVDSYHYYGNKDDYFEKHLKSLVKKGAPVAIAIPGTKQEMNYIIPDALKPFLDDFTAANVIGNAWKIVLAKPEVESDITRRLLEVPKIIYMNKGEPSPECNCIVCGQVLECFEHYFDFSGNQAAMINFAKGQLGSHRKEVAKNAEKFLRRHSGKRI